MIQSSVGHVQYNIDPVNLPFYKELFKFMGWKVLYEEPNMLGVEDEHSVSLWFTSQLKQVSNDYDGCGANHLGFTVPRQVDVDRAVVYLTEHGIASLFETPRHRPEFSGKEDSTYYQVMFESPDRLLFEIVYIGPKS